jgi:hypothetical protein
LTIRSTNGPIGLTHVTAAISARAENGPITIEGDGGNVSVETQNGPIAVRLMGPQWQSGELVARAQNGPLSRRNAATIRIRGGYRVVRTLTLVVPA